MSKILFLEKNKELIESLESLFATDQTELIITDSAKSIVKIAIEDIPDLILLDTDPSPEDAYTACKKINDRRKTKNIPVVFLISEKDKSDIRTKCLEAGAVDCLKKPLDTRKMLTKVHALIKRAQMLKKLNSGEKGEIIIRDELSQEIQKLNQINRRLEETAYIDRLTGLYDKSYFFKRLKEDFQHAKQNEIPISIIILDMDSFGRINDSYGHDVGDYVLTKIANVLLMNSRVADVVGRLEGANFAVILPGIDMQSGIFEAERLRIAINQTEYVDNTKIERKVLGRRQKIIEISITASIGLATFPYDEPIKNEMEFLALAKKALDRAKTTGKNKTISASDLLPKN